ncbi:transcriptional regulator [Salinarchaeum sp. IM2453]|uniref:transcriptional regulator n=1 Tax=Salinarchaeum sp. IM2453 TaxID=2862870 RepID=UPI001C836E8A|nr:transcriptional regulator [Salinarchaeum sp. IM2453]QZA89456.1 transcriptional regulator [Salinarchaeum sp. IM2453]
MSRSALVGNVIAMLEDAGFRVSDRCAIRPRSFDIAARRGEDLILVKILRNIDAFTAESGAEMRRIGAYLNGTPLVIGLRTRDEKLQPEVVYFRHGVPVLSPDTATDLFVEKIPPLIYAAPGGLYVSIDSEILADKREEKGWSLGQLASELGVSRRTVSKYEDGMDASIEVAAQLEELFDTSLTSPVSVLEEETPRQEEEVDPEQPDVDGDRQVVTVLNRVGYEVHPTVRAPFQAVSQDGDQQQDVILVGHSKFNETAEKRARLMSSVGEVARTHSVYFVNSTNRDAVGTTALIERDEASNISHAEEFKNLIRRRAREELA